MRRFACFQMLICVFALSSNGTVMCQDAQSAFQINLPKTLAEQPIDGRLFVFLTKRQGIEPRFGPNWFNPEPFFATDVKNFQPGSSKLIDDAADGCPGKVSKLAAGKYFAQAVLDHDFYSASPGAGEGNFYSEVLEVDFDPAKMQIFELQLSETVPPRKFEETDWLKEVRLNSKLLSDFHKRPVIERAAIVLPASYANEPDKRYPVLYVISGFSGTIERVAAPYRRGPPELQEGEVEMIRVLLTGECKWGHHAYANSATNGPRGDALVSELIPLIDSKFRTVADARARFVGGHSSGGWSSLWLQVNYPETFGGVWSTSPDPVDFRDFQQVDLYHEPPLSLYFDENGDKRPLARAQGRVLIWYPDFAVMDDVLGRGGQLRSFEAVFSPLDKNGLPAKLWGRKTGRIDPEIAQAWRSYDIRLILEENWKTLKDELAGKIHITMGDQDTFYLEGATILLKKTLEELGSDAEITIVPGADHGTVITRESIATQRKQIADAYLNYFNEDGSPK